MECIGTGFLLAAIVGSGIMASRLAAGNNGLELLINSSATGAALTALIVALGPLSGAHFNPMVTLALAMRSEFTWREVPSYVAAQIAGGLGGVAIANAMFGEPTFFLSHHIRFGMDLWLGEGVATFGLIAVVVSCIRFRSALTSVAVGGYIAAAYGFTSSTSFANPAVTIARSFSDTFAGIAPSGVLSFLLAQTVGTLLAVVTFAWIIPATASNAQLQAAMRVGSEIS